MYKLKILLSSLVVMLLSNCQWDLEEEIFPAYDQATSVSKLSESRFASRGVYEDPVNGEVYIGGTNGEGKILISKFDQNGFLQSERVFDSTGVVSAIVEGRSSEEFLLLAQDSLDSRVFSFNRNTGNFQVIDLQLFEVFNNELGLMKSVQLRSLEKIENGYLVGGQISQLLGGPRVAWVLLSDNLELLSAKNLIAEVSASRIAASADDFILSGIHRSSGELYFYRVNNAGAQQWQRRVTANGNSIGDFFINQQQEKIFYAINRTQGNGYNEQIRTIDLTTGDEEIVLVSTELQDVPARLAIAPFSDLDDENTILIGGRYDDKYVITNRSLNEEQYRWQRSISARSETGQILSLSESFDGGVLAVFLEQDTDSNTERVRIFKLDAVGRDQ